MFEAIKASIIHEVESHGDGSNGYHSDVVNSPPRSVATTEPESDHSLVESLSVLPPLRRSSQAGDLARDRLAAMGHAGKPEIMVQDIDADDSSFLENVQVSTLEYLNLRESPMVRRDENQSIGTYSYGRAYIDNATLGESICSALTDDYCYDARKVGMSEAIKPNIIREGVSHGGGSKGYHSGVVDSPPRAAVATTAHESDRSYVESLPAPPPPRQSSQAGDFTVYKNVENIERIGYVDEEAVIRHEATNKGNCSWFMSSSPCVKLVVFISMLMLLGSLARLALAF
jgi:hypothetical protein